MRDLLASERGAFAIVLVLAVSILAALRVITSDQWMSFATWMGSALIASKTITTAVELRNGTTHD